jgi:hypothetical protein
MNLRSSCKLWDRALAGKKLFKLNVRSVTSNLYFSIYVVLG